MCIIFMSENKANTNCAYSDRFDLRIFRKMNAARMREASTPATAMRNIGHTYTGMSDEVPGVELTVGDAGRLS